MGHLGALQPSSMFVCSWPIFVLSRCTWWSIIAVEGGEVLLYWLESPCILDIVEMASRCLWRSGWLVACDSLYCPVLRSSIIPLSCQHGSTLHPPLCWSTGVGYANWLLWKARIAWSIQRFLGADRFPRPLSARWRSITGGGLWSMQSLTAPRICGTRGSASTKVGGTLLILSMFLNHCFHLIL